MPALRFRANGTYYLVCDLVATLDLELFEFPEHRQFVPFQDGLVLRRVPRFRPTGPHDVAPL